MSAPSPNYLALEGFYEWVADSYNIPAVALPVAQQRVRGPHDRIKELPGCDVVFVDVVCVHIDRPSVEGARSSFHRKPGA